MMCFFWLPASAADKSRAFRSRHAGKHEFMLTIPPNGNQKGAGLPGVHFADDRQISCEVMPYNCTMMGRSEPRMVPYRDEAL